MIAGDPRVTLIDESAYDPSVYQLPIATAAMQAATLVQIISTAEDFYASPREWTARIDGLLLYAVKAGEEARVLGRGRVTARVHDIPVGDALYETESELHARGWFNRTYPPPPPKIVVRIREVYK